MAGVSQRIYLAILHHVECTYTTGIGLMARVLTIGAAQQGPVSRTESRADVVERLIDLLRQGHAMGCDLVVFTEVALVPFFPHWHMTDEEEIDGWFEPEMPGPDTQPLFDEARRLGVGFHLGYAELAAEEGEIRRFNAAVLVGPDGDILGHYRKIHLPGYDRYQRGQPFQNLEKLYFRVGNLGFRTWRAFSGVVGMMICNDRRWPESYRVLALQGAELILMGYNTPVHNPAKAGVEEGVEQIGGTCIVAPSGQIVAQATSLADELIVARCDLDLARLYRDSTFDFARHRRTEHYGLITERTAPVSPEEGD
jgi:predicted amidohydrolase